MSIEVCASMLPSCSNKNKKSSMLQYLLREKGLINDATLLGDVNDAQPKEDD